MDFMAKLSKAQQDLMLLVDYATRTPQQPTEEKIDQDELKSAITAVLIDPMKADIAEARAVWKGLDYFSTYLSPATLDGLRYACGTQKPPLRSRKLSLNSWVWIVLLTTIFLQCYAFFGNLAIDKIDKYSNDLLKLQQQIQAMESADPALRPIGKNKDRNYSAESYNNTYSIIFSYPHLISYSHKHDELDSAQARLCYSYRTVYQFNGLWGLIQAWWNLENPSTYWGREPCATDLQKDHYDHLTDYQFRNEDCKNKSYAECQTKYGSEFEARFTVKILDTIILPILYSVLGSLVWVIRDRQIKTINKSFTERDTYLRPTRIALAAALGSILGFFYSATIIGSTLASVPLAGIGFLVGYNTEAVLRWLDRFINSVSKLDARSQTPIKPNSGVK